MLRSFINFGNRSLEYNILKYFLSEATKPNCIASHHFCNVYLCVQKIGKFIAETNVQHVHSTLKRQGSGEQSGLDGPLIFRKTGNFHIICAFVGGVNMPP